MNKDCVRESMLALSASELEHARHPHGSSLSVHIGTFCR